MDVWPTTLRHLSRDALVRDELFHRFHDRRDRRKAVRGECVTQHLARQRCRDKARTQAIDRDGLAARLQACS